jgi:hypothetical protein
VLACVTLGALAAPAEAQLGALLSPGKLSKAHEKLEGITKCQSCHEQGQKVTPQKCLACHAPVAERIAKKFGVHKDVKGDCVACHAEHNGAEGQLRPFDQKAFDHAVVTGFPLTGKHVLGEKGCAACHKSRSFLDVSATCTSCHMDVHKGKFGATCTTCHTTQMPFKEFNTKLFDHSKAAFQLAGAHRAVACANCHVNNVYKGLKFATCTDCHRDPHRASFGATCTSCHVVDAWRTKKVDHARTAFALNGRHAAVDCAACHKQPAMKVKPKADSCASCHTDVHKGTFKQDCKSCHMESGWGNAPFDHSQTKFSLTGKHEGLTCEKCHKGDAAASLSLAAPSTRLAVNKAAKDATRDFRGLSTACASCHTDVHETELGQACENCHSSASFKLPSFKHTRGPEFFGGQHAALTCEKCHQPQALTRPVRSGQSPIAVKYKAATTVCVTCHKDVHLGQEGTACETCHSIDVAKFAVSTFAHATKTSFPLTGRHETTTCVKCHRVETGAFPAGQGTAVRFKGVGKQCVACHEDVHLSQFKDSCEACHQTSAFKIPKYAHRNAKKLSDFFVGSHQRAACAACHKPTTGQFGKVRGTAIRFAIDAQCVSCHKDIHRGSLGPDCASCHHP